MKQTHMHCSCNHNEARTRMMIMKFNERTASLELARTVKQNNQDDLRAVNKKTIDDEANRKQSVNMNFWHSIKQVVFVITCAAIVIYTLIHFARG